MDFAAVAELQVLLEGVPLPNERSSLVRYATREGATWQQLTLLRQLPERRFDNLDELAEELICVQPSREARCRTGPARRAEIRPAAIRIRKPIP